MTESNDVKFIRLAYTLALTSDDPITQNGAVVAYGVGLLTGGVNAFPKGVKSSVERWESPAKYQYVEHAERNVIYSAARQGIATRGLTMYCPWFACPDCARAIIQSGISEVVGHVVPERGATKWDDGIKVAYQMFDEAGVKYRHVECKIGVRVRLNGRLIEV
mgnify:CR=1 FL=1